MCICTLVPVLADAPYWVSANLCADVNDDLLEPTQTYALTELCAYVHLYIFKADTNLVYPDPTHTCALADAPLCPMICANVCISPLGTTDGVFTSN